MPVPDIAVIMTAANAAGLLPGALKSVELQDYPGHVDVVVAAADESTAAAATEAGARVVMNPTGQTPHGLNLALAESTGDVVVRIDAQSRIPPDYLNRSVEGLDENSADVVGGMQVPIGTTFWEKAIAAAMISRLGAGDSRYRIGGEAGPSDTVYLGVFRRETLDDLDGYDESFLRNQDYELNFRVRESGGTVWFDPGLKVQYRPRGSLRALATQYFDYGKWKRFFSRTHRGRLLPRQLAAPAVVVTLALTLVLGLVWPIAWWVPLGYVAALVGAGLFSLQGWGPSALGMPLALATMHLSWGLGFLFGQTKDR